LTLIFKDELGSVTVNQQDNYLGQSSCSSKVLIHTHTHPFDCSAWTTKVVGH